MPFRVTARTLLELGAELISSDAVALYELIKNSVDAGSPTVRINVQSVLPYSKYQKALELLAEGREVSEILDYLVDSVAPDAPPTARREFHSSLLNAGANSEIFGESLRTAYERVNFIEVSDDGEGMSLHDLDEVYLTIGTRSRRREKERWESVPDKEHRVLLGDKGVGRLSSMRLGSILVVQTTKAGERTWNRLDIDWRIFSHDSDALLEEIDISPAKGSEKSDRAQHGTALRICALKSDWNVQRFNELLETDFARMVDPFEHKRGNRLLRISYNGEQITLPQIAKRLFDLAHAKVKSRFHYDQLGAARLTGEMDYRLHSNSKKTINVSEVQLVATTGATSVNTLRTLGPFDVEFLWFNRKHLTALEGLGTRGDVLALVRQWAGGLMVFRDDFRINPYGGGDDDWLELDKKAFGRRGYKLNRQQIIGRVRLSWCNKYLVEQTNREGLVDNEYKHALVAILQRILEDFKTFSQSVEDSVRREDLTSLDVLRRRVADAKTDVQKRIREIAVAVPEQAGPLRQVERLVNDLAAQIDGVEEIVDDYKEDRRKFVHLAALGLMVELILHELGRVTGGTLATISEIDPRSLPGKLPGVFQSLESQLKTLQKRIQTLDPLSTARRQVKEWFSVRDAVQQVVDARAAQAVRHGVLVSIESEDGEPWKIRAVKGMLMQILENLLANSFYWVKQKKVTARDFKPKIKVTIDRRAQRITVYDNGPGVEPERAEEIFQPFVTSKPPAMGSGLGLYIARELAEYHKWAVDISHESEGRDGNLHTFVIDFAGEAK